MIPIFDLVALNVFKEFVVQNNAGNAGGMNSQINNNAINFGGNPGSNLQGSAMM